nr:hypothetical protein [Tanacetum cinerariifolium]
MMEQQVLNLLVEMMLVVVDEEQVLSKIGDELLVFDEQLVVDMINDAWVLHKTAVVKEVNRIVKQLVKAIDDAEIECCTKVDDCCSMEQQLQIAQEEEVGIQSTQEEFEFMATTDAYEETKRVKVNYRSAKIHLSENCYDNDIFNMFTEEEQYTKLLEPIPEPHQVQQNDSNVTFAISGVEQGGGTVEQHPTNVEETRVLYDSLYNNLAIEVEKVNLVNRKLRETNAELTTELARYKNQEKCFEISQEKYDKLERCYQKSVYQEQYLTKKINALHLSSEAAKFVRDFKSLKKEADESIAKHKALEVEIERLLRAVVSQYIMSIVQSNFVVEVVKTTQI